VDYEALQHVISSSVWDHRAVMDRVAREAVVLPPSLEPNVNRFGLMPCFPGFHRMVDVS
jgi:hypothetical protein